MDMSVMQGLNTAEIRVLLNTLVTAGEWVSFKEQTYASKSGEIVVQLSQYDNSPGSGYEQVQSFKCTGGHKCVRIAPFPANMKWTNCPLHPKRKVVKKDGDQTFLKLLSRASNIKTKAKK